MVLSSKYCHNVTTRLEIGFIFFKQYLSYFILLIWGEKWPGHVRFTHETDLLMQFHSLL